jgi:hypothetical protein
VLIELAALQTRPEPRKGHGPHPRSLPAPADSGSRRFLKLQASVSSGHRVQDLESKTLSGRIQWIGEQRLVDRSQSEFGAVLCQQHLARARADGAAFRESGQPE